MRACSRLGAAPACLFALALLALVAGSASVVHTHQSAAPAFFNEDHELIALAAVGSATAVIVPNASAAPFLDVAPLAPSSTVESQLAPPVRASDLRAPPAR